MIAHRQPYLIAITGAVIVTSAVYWYLFSQPGIVISIYYATIRTLRIDSDANPREAFSIGLYWITGALYVVIFPILTACAIPTKHNGGTGHVSPMSGTYARVFCLLVFSGSLLVVASVADMHYGEHLAVCLFGVLAFAGSIVTIAARIWTIWLGGSVIRWRGALVALMSIYVCGCLPSFAFAGVLWYVSIACALVLGIGTAVQTWSSCTCARPN